MTFLCPICGKEMRDIVHFKNDLGTFVKAMHCWDDNLTTVVHENTESIEWKKEQE